MSVMSFVTLGLLYFVQGGPYGFQSSCLPLILREKGLSFTAIGVMKLLFLPWILKPLYSPIIETTKTKKWWLILSLFLLGVTCLFASSWNGNMVYLYIILFCFNLFAASQDIATDTLAVKLLSPSELGIGNMIQVVAYKLGSLFAGGILLYIENYFGWSGMFIVFSSVYFLCIFAISSIHLDSSDSSTKTISIQSNRSYSFRDTMDSIFKVPGTLEIILFVVVYKLCERSIQSYSLYLVDRNIPSDELAFYTTLIQSISLIGSALAGFIITTNNIVFLLKVFTFLRGIGILGTTILILLNTIIIGHTEWTMELFYYGLLCNGFTVFCAGILTTVTFTLMMKRSKENAPEILQGTYFTTLATAEVMGKLLFSSLSGWFIDYFGLSISFIIFTILGFLCYPFIPKNTIH